MVEDGKNIDDKFRTRIIWFINSTLSEFINFQDRQLNIWNNLKLETTKYYFNNSKSQSILEVEAEFFKDIAKKDVISISVKEDRSGEMKSSNHQVKLSFNSWLDKNTLSFLFDTNTFWRKDKADFSVLKSTIQDYLKKFDKSYSIINNQNKKFIGWINIILHPQNEVFIPNSEDLKKEIKYIKGNRECNLIFALIPVWNSIKPLILTIKTASLASKI